jgi:hypothetical protein
VAIPIVKDKNMYIKTLITGLTLSMLMSSGAANADWGDVYYCQMTNFDEITLEGEKKNWKLEKFQFKLDQTKNAMVLGSTGYLRDMVFELVIGQNWPSQENWYGINRNSMTYFDNGKHLFTSNGSSGITSISADCDKF